jgi:hypothetical protein
VGYIPDKVVFIDDLLGNLQSVEYSLGQLGVSDVMAFHFLGADTISNEVDMDVAELQFKTLVEREEWLNDSLAHALLLNQLSDESFDSYMETYPTCDSDSI